MFKVEIESIIYWLDYAGYLPFSSTLRQCSWALCFNINCSRNKKVRLWGTFCLNWTTEFHKWGVNDFLQSSHCKFFSKNVIKIVFCISVLLIISLLITTLILTLLEWGSVHISFASMILMFLVIPFILLRHILSMSLDSLSQYIQGGPFHLSQVLHCCMSPVNWIPSATSICLKFEMYWLTSRDTPCKYLMG